MYQPKRPRFHPPKVRVTRYVAGRMKTTHEPLVLNEHQLLPDRLHTVAETSVVNEPVVTACNSVTYSHRKQKSVDDWIATRRELDDALILSEGCTRETCIECNMETSSIIKCFACGPTYWACEECAIYRHKLSPLHSLQIWKVMT
jgi:hypothetical protein